MSDQSHQEPFLINAATIESPSAGYQPAGRVRSKFIESRNSESKIEEGLANPNLDSTKRRTTLRRRYRGRRSGNLGDARPPEESKHDLSTSPREIFEETKELDETPAKPPRHTSTRKPDTSTRKPDITVSNKKVDERHHQSRPSLSIMHNSNYIRKPDEKLREKFNRLRSVADGIPEVHFIGEITEGIGFKDTYVSCKWHLEWGKDWSFLAGEESSQTQYSAADNDGIHVFNHPLDVHFAAASLKGWPRIIVQVWELDEYGRSMLSGYGFCHLPTNPGCHTQEIRCWRPTSTSYQSELQSFFLGTSSCLVDDNTIFGKGFESRSQLTSISSGIVKMEVNVLLRFFGDHK